MSDETIEKPPPRWHIRQMMWLVGWSVLHPSVTRYGLYGLFCVLVVLRNTWLAFMADFLVMVQFGIGVLLGAHLAGLGVTRIFHKAIAEKYGDAANPLDSPEAMEFDMATHFMERGRGVQPH